MKRFETSIFLFALALMAKAQSSEAGYPVGTWQSNPETSEVFVDMSIWRENTPNPDYGNKLSCGELSIDDSPSYDAMLTYSGRALDKNGLPLDIFFFNVVTANNKTSRIGIKKTTNDNSEYGNATKISIVSVTGDLANNTALKQQLYSVGVGNGAAFDPTPWVVTDKELLESLKEGLVNGWNLRGFGNVRQYVNAHSKLTFGKPRYAKCKGAGNINIRKDGDTKAEKIGELTPGTTLLVVDEFNGWCQVRMKEKQFGWVSLSVVELTNTPSAITTAEVTATTNSVGLSASSGKNPITGSWYYEHQYGLELDLKETAKKGNFIHNNKTVCHGGLAVSEYFEYFIMLSMQVKQVISNAEVEYTVWGSDERKPSKTVKGTICLKKVGDRLLITGKEANGKKWPFDGFYLNKSN